MSGPEPIAWTGSGSLVALVHGVDGHIWPEQADAHPIPLYSQSALRAAREAALREAAATVTAGDTVQAIQRKILALIPKDGEKP